MSDGTLVPLSVAIRELPAVHVAHISYEVVAERGNPDREIRDRFRRVQDWVRDLGYDPYTSLTIGVLNMVAGELTRYDCCVQIPESVRGGSGDLTM